MKVTRGRFLFAAGPVARAQVHVAGDVSSADRSSTPNFLRTYVIQIPLVSAVSYLGHFSEAAKLTHLTLSVTGGAAKRHALPLPVLLTHLRGKLHRPSAHSHQLPDPNGRRYAAWRPVHLIVRAHGHQSPQTPGGHRLFTFVSAGIKHIFKVDIAADFALLVSDRETRVTSAGYFRLHLGRGALLRQAGEFI